MAILLLGDDQFYRRRVPEFLFWCHVPVYAR